MRDSKETIYLGSKSKIFLFTKTKSMFKPTFSHRRCCFVLMQVQQRYKKATGYLPFIFEGSSPGAGKFGYLRIHRRATSKKANTGEDAAAVTLENSS